MKHENHKETNGGMTMSEKKMRKNHEKMMKEMMAPVRKAKGSFSKK